RPHLNQNVNNVDLNSLLKDGDQSSHAACIQSIPTTSVVRYLLFINKHLHVCANGFQNPQFHQTEKPTGQVI
ncbi:hypothetical protein, partial [Pseudomonas amygdali]|uniref:hypothetical protein n=1 Tax=Pseudomonas amygdali TaxID=47877 RepID=UPI0019D3437E